jgi:YgiT-type zinc finger domain-containing protein
MSQQCSFCGHVHLSEQHTRYIHGHGDDLLIVEDVPCLKCECCGEQYFSIDALKIIESDHAALAGHPISPERA